MSSSSPTPSFDHCLALVLHQPHALVNSIIRQLRQIGMTTDVLWPDLPASIDITNYAVMFFDADRGHDSQFPWGRGEAPMPTVALIGSETPGRIQWAMHRGADAHLLKPIGSGGIYSAMLIANHAFEQRRQLKGEIEGLRHRLSRREELAAATAQIMTARNISATEAYKALRLMAMSERLSIEDMAARLIETRGAMVNGNGRA